MADETGAGVAASILSDITVFMKYAKYNESLGRRETWEELVTRNKNMHIKKYPFLKDEINEKYKLVYDKKVLPSMRSMQFGGKPIEISPNRIYNCAYLPIDHLDSFSETMFLLLGGTGVGYSVQKHTKTLSGVWFWKFRRIPRHVATTWIFFIRTKMLMIHEFDSACLWQCRTENENGRRQQRSSKVARVQ